MIGAKLPFLLTDYEGLVSGAAWFSNGKTIMLGMVGGYAGVEIAKWILRVNVKTGDGFAVPVAVTVAIGRFGCFHGGCCFGAPTNLCWGVAFPISGDQLPRHPTQPYETLFHLAAAGILLLLKRRQLFQGHLIKLYIIAYMAYRFGTEWIRPEPGFWLGLTAYQWAALAIIPCFGWLWWRDNHRFEWPLKS